MGQDRSLATALGWGVLYALALGMILGWLRYWLGLFILAQGAVAGLMLPWLMGRTGSGRRARAGHPGFALGLALAAAWLACFLAGQAVGFGLAQPWFDPLGFVARVWKGDSSEFVFGVAATGVMHRALALGARGGFWLLLNLLDLGIMFFFFLIMPWNRAEKENKGAQPPAAPPEVAS